MNARLLILLVLVLGLFAVWWSTRQSGPAVDTTIADNERKSDEDYEIQTELTQRPPPPGEEPAVPPQFAVAVEVDTSAGKNRLKFAISEKNGYYVESMDVQFWYVKPGGPTEPEDSPLKLTHRVNDYMEAKKTFEGYIEVVPAELTHVGGHIGTSENWRARVTWHHRARTENPNPLPRLPHRLSGGK